MAEFGYGYTGYLPEMKGLTEIQKQDYADQMAKQKQVFTAGAARSGGLQSSGAYLMGLASLGSQEARGLNAIERENQLKNALLAREERLAQESRNWQKQMSDIAFQRQKELIKQQQDFQLQQALLQGLGALAGTGLNYGISYLNRSPLTKMFENMTPSELKDLLGITPGYAPGFNNSGLGLGTDYSGFKNIFW